MSPVHNIDAVELTRLQQNGPVVLIDVRTDAEVARGIIPTARHIPLHLLAQRLAELDPDATTIVYCQSGGRSAQACAWLGQQGFGSVMNLQGGIMGWLRDGHPVEGPR
jgi:rhodanese-related sulfurtransferase